MIWRSGGAAVVYRGKNYVPPSVRYAEEKVEEERKRLMSLDLEEEDSVDVVTTTEKVVADNISGVQAVFRFIFLFSSSWVFGLILLFSTMLKSTPLYKSLSCSC